MKNDAKPRGGALKAIKFSEMKLGWKSVEFLAKQLGIYAKLVEKHPENKTYEKTKTELENMMLEFVNELIVKKK